MALDTQKLLLIEQRITNMGRSTLIAYILWFFFYAAGAHRFYLGYRKSAFAMFMVFVTGLVLTRDFTVTSGSPDNDSFSMLFCLGAFVVGIIFAWLALSYVFAQISPDMMLADPLHAIASCLPYAGPLLLSLIVAWAIVDAFLIPGIIVRQKDALRQTMSTWEPEQFV